jgi:hypothetical protein
MSSPSIKNNMTTLRYLRRFGVIDSITILRGCSHWPYVQKNMFLGQGSDFDKVFLFKILEVGLGSNVDLVKLMQLGGDLQDAWIMFDHMKCVKKWTIVACHVYNSTYCCVMTITVYNMQSEDVATQSILLKNLNIVLARHGIPEPKFKGLYGR